MSLVRIDLIGRDRFPLRVADYAPVSVQAKTGDKELLAHWDRSCSEKDLPDWIVIGMELTIDPGTPHARQRIEFFGYEVKIQGPTDERKGDEFNLTYNVVDGRYLEPAA